LGRVESVSNLTLFEADSDGLIRRRFKPNQQSKRISPSRDFSTLAVTVHGPVQ